MSGRRVLIDVARHKDQERRLWHVTADPGGFCVAAPQYEGDMAIHLPGGKVMRTANDQRFGNLDEALRWLHEILGD
jgi:hypothetical protein